MRRDGGGVQRGGHYDEPQIPPARSLQRKQERQGQVAFQVSLMELVQHDETNVAQVRIRRQAPVEHAFRQVAEPRARSREILKANLIADGIAKLFPAPGGDMPGREAGGQAARFQNEDLTIDAIE
jgi:hypothetical protein